MILVRSEISRSRLKVAAAMLSCACLAVIGASFATPTAATAVAERQEDQASSSVGAYDVYVGCSRNSNALPSSRCFVGDRIGAFFRSNAADSLYSVCITFPNGRELCAQEQVARQGQLYVNAVTTNLVGSHIVTWSVDGLVFTRQFTLAKKESPSQQSRTCGILPGDGAYRYIKTRGISCRDGMHVANRARKKFCSAHNQCLINPPTPITTVYTGQVRYNGWNCRIKDGWELTVVRCTKRDMRLFLKSAA